MNALEKKRKVFSAHPVFSSLSEKELAELASFAGYRDFPAGSTIFSTGDMASCMYIVASGEVSVMKTGEYIDGVEIARLVAGDSLGEIDMIAGTPRTVTSIAATPVSLVCFPAENMDFRSWLEKNPGPGSRILFSFISDIAERTRKANSLLKENSPQIQELRHQIYEDKLTGLHNRVYLEETLPSIIESSKDSETSLLMFKPDNFKQVNDHAGHEAGDSLLVHLAHLFPSILPASALLARYSGNEFALVLKNSGREEALKMAETIKTFYNALDLSSFLPVQGIHLTVSTGIAVYPEHASKSAGLIEKAHSLPLVGRAMGGNKVLFPEDGTGVTA